MFDLGVVLHVEIKSWSLLQVKGSNSGPLLNSFSIIYYLWGYRVAGNCIALYYWCCSKTLKKDHNQNVRSGAIYTSFWWFLPWLNFASPKFHFSCTCCFRALFKIYFFQFPGIAIKSIPGGIQIFPFIYINLGTRWNWRIQSPSLHSYKSNQFSWPPSQPIPLQSEHDLVSFDKCELQETDRC